MELRVAVSGDQRVVENLILEVRAIAQRCGLEIPNIRVVRQPKVGPKTPKKKKSNPRRKCGS
jgi:hypothetical protein